MQCWYSAPMKVSGDYTFIMVRIMGQAGKKSFDPLAGQLVVACGCHLFWKRVPFHVRGRSTRVYPELGQTPGIPGYYSTRVYPAPKSAQVLGIHG